MGSLFSKEPPPREPTAIERIGPEISHLKNKTSVRHGNSARRKGAWVMAAVLGTVLWLYFMDPILYAWHKSDAVQTYLYLHTFDSAGATQGLITSGIFTEREIQTMNDERGSYQDYFASPQEAQQKAASIVRFMKGLDDLHAGRYDQLDPIGKIRYTLFVKVGLLPPARWDFLNPSVN